LENGGEAANLEARVHEGCEADHRKTSSGSHKKGDEKNASKRDHSPLHRNTKNTIKKFTGKKNTQSMVRKDSRKGQIKKEGVTSRLPKKNNRGEGRKETPVLTRPAVGASRHFFLRKDVRPQTDDGR